MFRKLEDVIVEHEEKKAHAETSSNGQANEFAVSTWIRTEVRNLMSEMGAGDTIQLREFVGTLYDQLGTSGLDEKKTKDRLTLYVRNEWNRLSGTITRVGARAYLSV